MKIEESGGSASDPLVRNMDLRIRIHTKMSWIRNTGNNILIFVMQEASPVASTKKDAAAAAAVVPATAAAMEDGEDEAAAQEDGDEARSEATFSFKA